MPKEDDRHIGQRVDMFFPSKEYKDMTDAMAVMHETNRSLFIRSAVHNYVKWVNEAHEKGEL